MTREEAILEMWGNYEDSVSQASGTRELKHNWESEFLEGIAVLGVSSEELLAVLKD